MRIIKKVCIFATNISTYNIIMNMIFAPLLGQVIAICIDDWYLIPKETSSIYQKFMKSEPPASTNTVSGLVEIHGKLDNKLAESEEFRPIIIQTINIHLDTHFMK